MKWIHTLQQVIASVEARLNEDVRAETLAKECFATESQLQRIFPALFGCTLTQYIRNRRLSIAGEEIAAGAIAWDTAHKYGYQSYDSFSQAFRRFHGLLPSQVNGRREVLKGCNPISFALAVKGGTVESVKSMQRDDRKPVLAWLEYEYHFLPMDGDLASHLAHVKQTLSELGCCYRDVLYQFPPEYQNVFPWPVEKATAFTVDGINWWSEERLGGMYDQLSVSGEVWSISIMEREDKPSPDDTCRRISEALGWQVDPEWLVPIHAHTVGWYANETREGGTT